MLNRKAIAIFHATSHIHHRYHTLMKIGITSFITIILLMIVVISMGGGHGTYLPAKVVYPITMIISILSKNGIGTFAIIIAIIQIPVYALILNKKPKRIFYIIGIHIILVIICLNLPTESFT